MEVRVLDVTLETEEVEISTSDSKAFRRLLNAGYSVIERKDGICTLNRGAHVWVTIEHDGNYNTIDLKKELSLYYTKTDTVKAADFFKKDSENERVQLILDPEGYYTIVRK